MSHTRLEDIREETLTEVQRLIGAQGRWSQPFRNRFDHTLRVQNWARRLHTVEGGDLEIVTFAVLFHDTGWSETVDHALVGAELAEGYLLDKGVDPLLVDRIVSAVRTHNKRQVYQEGLPIENLIVMDADLLDEIGVTTLVWDALSTAMEEDPGYVRVLEKDLKFHQKARERSIYLKTGTGRKLYAERLAVWEMCLSHLRYELGLSNEFAS